MLQNLVALVGGVLTLVIFVRFGRMTLRERRRATQLAGTGTYVGGVRYHATGGVNSGARSNFTRPFAQLEVEDDQISVTLNREAMAIARWTGISVDEMTSLRRDEIDHVETRFGVSRGLRFRTCDAGDHRDGLVFWPRRRDREDIVRRLQATGLRVG
jgi:hypothetical protein